MYQIYGGVNMGELLEKKCIPCSISTDPLNEEEINEYMEDLEDGWDVVENKKISKIYNFKDFKEALDFTNKVGNVAEEEGHHPIIILSYGRVKIKLYTHKINGLHENDFIMAAKIDNI